MYHIFTKQKIECLFIVGICFSLTLNTILITDKSDFLIDDSLNLDLEIQSEQEDTTSSFRTEYLDTKEWWLIKVNADDVHSSYKGDDIKVAIIDTGIDTNHEEFDTTYIGGKDYEATPYDDIPEDETGHGTKVAGMIAAEDDNSGIVGIAPNVKLYVLKAFYNTIQDSYYNDEISLSIQWAIDNDMDIISMCFGDFDEFTTFKSKLEAAFNAGIILVNAAGNDGDDEVRYPGRYNYDDDDFEVISVGATDSSDYRCSFSNYGTGLDLYAPGNDITTTNMGGGLIENTYGTSASAPIVAGICALILDKNPYIETCGILNLLIDSGTDISLDAPRVDADAAIDYMTDTDGDGLIDYAEDYDYGTDDQDSDSDDDGWNDGLEIIDGSDPNDVNDYGPHAPRVFKGVSDLDDTLTFSWIKPDNHQTGWNYNVYRSTSYGTKGTCIKPDFSGTCFDHTPPSATRTYYYRCYCIDSFDNEGMIARWQGKAGGGGGGPMSFLFNQVGYIYQRNNFDILAITFLSFLSLAVFSLAVFLTNWSIFNRIRRIKQKKIL